MALGPCSDVIAAARMKSALTKCVQLIDGQSGKLDVRMDGGGGAEWELNADKENERQRGITH